MKESRDPLLQAWFDEAREDLEDTGFTSELMARVQHQERLRSLRRVAIDVALVLLAWLVMDPLQGFVYGLMPGLMSSLVEFDNRWLAEALLPVNNLAAVLAFIAVVARSLYRRLFH